MDSQQQKVISTNIRNQENIPLTWMQLWGQIEIWYGDIRKKETGEELLKRLQSEFDLKAKMPTH